jgi:hypothetical protein
LVPHAVQSSTRNLPSRKADAANTIARPTGVGENETVHRRRATMSLLFHMIGGAPHPVAPVSQAGEAVGWVLQTGPNPLAGT